VSLDGVAARSFAIDRGPPADVFRIATANGEVMTSFGVGLAENRFTFVAHPGGTFVVILSLAPDADVERASSSTPSSSRSPSPDAAAWTPQAGSIPRGRGSGPASISAAASTSSRASAPIRRGSKNVVAMTVGMTAERITTATRIVYAAWSM